MRGTGLPARAGSLFAREALLPDGWARDVRIEVDARGSIAAVRPGAGAAGALALAGPVVPGLCDLHCHAFQRAMAGRAERKGAGKDSFWTWRATMYGSVAAIRPGHLEAIAAQLYVDLLKGGYTSVCEFHYVHHGPDGRPYAQPEEMSGRIVRAARRAGIGLTLLPVLYMTSGFGGQPPEPGQRRFVTTPDRLLEIVARLRARYAGDDVRIGVAPHSLRAVTPDGLRALVEGMAAVDRDAPIHVHVAEQDREVEECLAARGRRPVAWLLDHAPVSPRWCLVHATHMSPDETASLARSGAVAGLCPTTEANLGDGLFPLADYLARGGSFGVGSDSNVSVSAAEELRWLEYGQRLFHRCRAVAGSTASPSVGSALFAGALAGGALAAGRPVDGLRPGQRADLVTLDPDAPALVGRTGPDVLDAFVFCGGPALVRDVVVGGRRVVEGGRHVREDEVLDDLRRALGDLARTWDTAGSLRRAPRGGVPGGTGRAVEAGA